MRITGLYTVALILGTTSLASAQQGYYPSTLDSQYQRMNPNQPAAAAPTGASREWPAAPQDAVRPGEAIGSVGNGAIPALPLQPMTAGNITYLNGGIGDEEVAQLKAQASSYNLHLLLSATNGEYISDVSLRILDSSGKEVLSIPDAGPYVYASLPAGKYTLEATSKTAGAKSIKINAGKGAIKQHIAFKE